MNREEARRFVDDLNINTLEDAFIEGYNEGLADAIDPAEEGKWHDASKVLPPMEQMVLCSTGLIPFLATRCSEGKSRWYWEDTEGAEVTAVRYWMAIPDTEEQKKWREQHNTKAMEQLKSRILRSVTISALLGATAR